MALQLLHLRLNQAVHKAVTALPLAAPHDHQIKVILLCKGICQPGLQIILFRYPGGNLIPAIRSRPLNLLPELSKGNARLHAKHLIEI